MSPAELAAIAGIFAAIVALIGLVATAIFRIGKLTEATDRFPIEMRAESQRIHDRINEHETLNREQFRHNEELAEERFRRNEELAEERARRIESLIRSEGERNRELIRNLQQAIMSHSHDEDGNVIFRIPPSDPHE